MDIKLNKGVCSPEEMLYHYIYLCNGLAEIKIYAVKTYLAEPFKKKN